jgi:hypothetical protein
MEIETTLATISTVYPLGLGLSIWILPRNNVGTLLIFSAFSYYVTCFLGLAILMTHNTVAVVHRRPQLSTTDYFML